MCAKGNNVLAEIFLSTLTHNDDVTNGGKFYHSAGVEVDQEHRSMRK